MSDSKYTNETKPKDQTNLKMLLEGILILGLTMFSSCTHYQCDPAYVGPIPRSAVMLEYYSYPRQEVEAKIEIISEKKHYAIKRIEFPSALNVFGTENIIIDYYEQKQPGKFPTILILPISGGIDFTVKSFARHFASRGFNCAAVHNRQIDPQSTGTAEEVENYFRQTVLDNRQALDYLLEREEVDENKLGCLGLSLGGIKASLVCGADKRLKCSVLGLAGGSIADIALLSKERDLKNSIKKLKEEGASTEDIRIELSEKVATDPLKLAGYINARNVLMYIAAFDRVVPRKCGDKLWEAIGKPEVIYLPTGHYSSFLFLPYAQAKSLSFFEKKFELE